MDSKRIGAFAIAGAVIGVSFAAPLFRLAPVGPIPAAAYRLLIAGIILLPWYRGGLPNLRQHWKLLFASGLFLALHFAAWVASLQYTTVAASVSLVTLQAIIVSLLGVLFLRERIPKLAWVGIGFATVCAIALGLTGGSNAAVPNPNPMLGNGLAVLGAFGSAVYFLIGRKLRSKISTIDYAVPVYFTAGLALLFTSLVFGHSLRFDNWVGGSILLLLALVPMIGGHTLANFALKTHSPSVVSTWILLEPLGATLLAIPFLGETPTLATVILGLGVLAGAVLASRPS